MLRERVVWNKGFLKPDVCKPIVNDGHQLYRQALAQEPVVDAAGTKRELEREDALFEPEIQERKLALEERKSHMGVEVDERKLALQEKKL